MARSQKRLADIGFSAITIEGGLISPDQVVKVASTTPDQKTAAEYSCPKGVSLRDEITRYFQIGKAIWKSFASIETPTQQLTEAFVEELLNSAFGFELKRAGPRARGDRRFAIAFEGSEGRVPVVVTAPLSPEEDGKSKDAFTVGRTQFGDGANGRIAKRSAALLLQDWLNANADFYWGLVFAGDRVRLMRDNASFTRPAFIEADLGAIFRDDMFAEFTAWWLLTHASRFGKAGAPPSEAPLEHWREAGMEAGTAVRDKLRGNVESALLAIGKGLLGHNPELRRKIDDSELSMQSLFEQMLRTVYRLIFLAVAEDRDLLHAPGTARATKQLYQENYGFAYLRNRSARRGSRDTHGDAWEGLKIVFNALARGEKDLGLPALGGLFSADATPDLEQCTIPNRFLLEAIFNLGWMMEEGRRVRINWRDMATEEFGSVYEGLLELTPTRTDEGRSFDFVEDLKGNARKTSGSYYTPDSLVQTLLDSALNPVLEKAEAEGREEGILDLKIIDPACGSGHFLLGAARRMATRVAQLRDPDAPDYNRALREVVARCVHGVDRNPMAVELAKVALWIESVSPGQPLGFLDANIRCGDALLGVFDLEALEQGIPDDAYKPLTGDVKEAAAYYKKKNKDEKKGQGSFDFDAGTGAMPPKKLAANLSTIRRMPEDTVGQVEKKREAFEAWKNDPDRRATRVACDFYTAAFLLPKLEVPDNYQRGTVPTTADVWKRLGGGQVYGPLEAAAVDASEEARAFHWPLAFPDVLIGKGGFDVVLGNPPYLSALEQTRMGIEREREFWRCSKSSAKGAFDLYVLFLELGLVLSRKGRCSLLTPNKYLSAPYGEALRTLIRDTNTLESVIDESAGNHFADASVYPVITNFDSSHSAQRREIMSFTPTDGRRREIAHTASELFALPNVNLGPLLSKEAPLLYRVLRQTCPLETLGDVNASTTAAEADEFTAALDDDGAASSSESWKVLNTGLIDPFRVKWGEQPLRHAKRNYHHPVFWRDDQIIPARRRDHYASPKLIFAKLANSPEVFVDEFGDYAALNVNFMFVGGDKAFFIAAQLNSLIGDWLYRQLFAALAMSGGYLQYQAPQIRAWPVLAYEGANPLHNEVVRIARAVQAGGDDNALEVAVAKCFGLSTLDLETMAGSLNVDAEATHVGDEIF